MAISTYCAAGQRLRRTVHQALAPNLTLPGTKKRLAGAAADLGILTEVERRDTAVIVLLKHAPAGGQQA